MGPIDVEDVPFLAVEMFIAGQGREQMISLRTNVDQIITIGDEHPLHVEHDAKTDETIPYVLLSGHIEARLARSLYYELVSLGQETEMDGRKCLAVWSSGRQFPLGWLDKAP
jgi:hypothetical protein